MLAAVDAAPSFEDGSGAVTVEAAAWAAPEDLSCEAAASCCGAGDFSAAAEFGRSFEPLCVEASGSAGAAAEARGGAAGTAIDRDVAGGWPADAGDVDGQVAKATAPAMGMDTATGAVPA